MTVGEKMTPFDTAIENLANVIDSKYASSETVQLFCTAIELAYGPDTTTLMALAIADLRIRKWDGNLSIH